MNQPEKIFIKCNEIKLEAEIFTSDSQNNPIVLISHPHPQMGGSMNNNVVSGIFNYLIKKKISSLRFNFRGVGKSTGSSSGGKTEIKDVKCTIEYLLKEKNYKKVLICGYSFGAAIGCSVVNDFDNVIGFIAISFPWDYMGRSFKRLSQTSKPKLFIQGDQDQIASFSKFKDHYRFYDEPKQYQIIKGADHFYWGYENKVANYVFEFYKPLA